MKMNQYIRQLRENAGMSQEELGNMLIPRVNRAAVQKWEVGAVENLKRTHIEQLAKIFGVKPSNLMCFEEADTPSDSIDILYSKLDEIDKAEIRGTIKQMLKADKYTKKEKAIS